MLNVECSMLNETAIRVSAGHSTFNIEHSTFNIWPLNMVNPQNGHHDRDERAGADDGGAAGAVRVVDVRLKHDGKENPGNDGADLLDAQVHQACGRSIRPEGA